MLIQDGFVDRSINSDVFSGYESDVRDIQLVTTVTCYFLVTLYISGTLIFMLYFCQNEIWKSNLKCIYLLQFNFKLFVRCDVMIHVRWLGDFGNIPACNKIFYMFFFLQSILFRIVLSLYCSFLFCKTDLYGTSLDPNKMSRYTDSNLGPNYLQRSS